MTQLKVVIWTPLIKDSKYYWTINFVVIVSARLSLTLSWSNDAKLLLFKR